MVSAYTAFPNKGIRVAPLFVTRIEDNDGNVLATFSPEMQEVISASSAYKMLVMLRAVINEGTGVGVLFCLLAFIGIIFVIVRALMFGDPTSGWPSLVCIILLCSGVQLFCTGIVGEYLAKTYLEVKHRPIYIVAETEEDKK